MDIISQGKISPHADKTSKGKPTSRANSHEGLKEYLDHLDNLYEDIKNNGYKNSSVIAVSIGREGNWMTNHGNHRHTIAAILDIETIPVQVIYRHKEWQTKRMEIYNTSDPTKLSGDLKQHLDHPDIIL